MSKMLDSRHSTSATMKLLGLLVCLVATVAAAPGKDHYELARGGRVVGGVNALPNEFPSIISLQRLILTLSAHICGGSIISQRWVLTAAHCITESPENARFAIWAGAHDITVAEPNRQVINVDDAIVHPEYLGGVNPSDVAVLRLVSYLNFNQFVQPSVLPAQGDLATGAATLAGWGSTSTGSNPSMPAILQKVQKPIIDYATCEEANGGAGNSPLGPTNVCTGPLTGGVSACSGDSGGPLYVTSNGVRTQVGIVSWGWMPCGSIGRPSVYVGVASYRNWIDSQAV
ncbi:trypsin-1-like [Topomyia yanbarensis]|uniref:trypsin-1-like n=1 Tax=Topomyia yanbarensis TaxID=2498891 RepID=UPI00273A9142|nr:trypsin-1-like [Topomyia yanbarensis]